MWTERVPINAKRLDQFHKYLLHFGSVESYLSRLLMEAVSGKKPVKVGIVPTSLTTPPFPKKLEILTKLG